MVRVMVFGSFDPLHAGHRSLFRQARRYGNELVVVVARDASIRRIKRHEPRHSEEERLAALEALETVDFAVLGHEEDFLEVVERWLPDVLVLGYDQEVYPDEVLRKELAARSLHPEIKRAISFRPERYKSSRIVAQHGKKRFKN